MAHFGGRAKVLHVDGEKRCGKCRKYKPVSKFFARKRSWDGLAGRCKVCSIKQALDWISAKSPEERRAIYHARDLKRKFGITRETYQVMLIAQNGVCAICNQPCPTGNRLAVDHDHSSKEVRGLLCSLCNMLLHKVETDPAWMDKALSYLSKHAVENMLKREG